MKFLSVNVQNSSKSPASARLGALETLRGVGALVVLLHHLSLAFIPHAYLGTEARPHFEWEGWLHSTPLGLLIAGRFAVDVFFVLSGFVLALGFVGPAGKGDGDLAAAAVKRVFRLAPIVAVGVLLPWLFHWPGWLASKAAAEVSGSQAWLALQGGWKAPPVTLLKLIGFNLFSQGEQFNSALWTIELELLGSYFVYFALFVLRRSRWRWGIYLWLAVALRHDLLLAFLAGLVLADLHATVPPFRTWSRRVGILAPALALSWWWGSYPEGLVATDQSPAGWHRILPRLALGKDGWLLLGAVLLIAASVGSPAVLRVLDCRLGRFLGRISFALYATHIPIICSLGSLLLVSLSAGGMAYGPAAGIAATASIVAALVFAMACTRWIDHPSLRFSNRVGCWFAGSGCPPAGIGTGGGEECSRHRKVPDTLG